MFGWLKKKNPLQHIFDSNEAAFNYACQNLPNKVLMEAIIPAIVLEAGDIKGGERHFLLRLADKAGGWETWGCTLKGAPAYPAVGDLVGYRIVRIASDLPAGMNVIGFIAVQLAPVFVDGKGWKTVQSFVPGNLKPTVRF